MLHLEALGATASDTTTVLIQDISRTGILLETSGDLSMGETIEIELPGTTGVHAIIKWASGQYYGCEFKAPITDAVVSAALLRASPKPIPGVTAAPGTPNMWDEAEQVSDKLPRVIRVRLLFGLAIASWSAIGTAALLLALL